VPCTGWFSSQDTESSLWKIGILLKNSGHFIQLLKSVNLQSPDTLVSFDVVSLFTNVPADEALQVISKELRNDDTLAERSVLQAEAIMELLEVCLKTTYFQVDDRFFQPIVCNMYMEHFEKLALDSAHHKPSLWLRYVGDIFVVWPHSPDRLHNFLNHPNSLRPSIQFTMEIESNNAVPFLDVLVISKETTLATRVHRKPTHTG
jgi:hypothetical protein